MRELYKDIGLVQATSPAVLVATNTSAAIDLAGFGSATVLISTGAIVLAGDFTTKLQESDTTTSGDFTDVAVEDVVGAFPASLAADTLYKVGYRGTKRYVRTVTTKNSGTSIIACVFVAKGHPLTGPVA